MNKQPSVYAFIDAQNLNLGVKSQDWQIDYRKFRLYLKNKYGVSKAFLFIGKVPGNKKLYKSLEMAGFDLVFKPTVRYFENGRQTVKGNVDAELVLHAAAIEFNKYDKAVLVSGDGDFLCLVEYLASQDKLLYVLAPNRHYSGLLRKYDQYIKRIDKARGSLEITNKTTRTSGRSKP